MYNPFRLILKNQSNYFNKAGIQDRYKKRHFIENNFSHPPCLKLIK